MSKKVLKRPKYSQKTVSTVTTENITNVNKLMKSENKNIILCKTSAGVRLSHR